MAVPPLLAAGINGIEGLVSLLFILVWIVSQVRHLFGGADRGGPAVPRPRVDDEQHRELMRQIDEIIGRATGERAPPSVPRRDRGESPRGPAVPTRAAGGTRPAPGGRRPARSDANSPRPGARPAIAAGEPPRTLGSLGGHAADVARHVDDAFAHEIAHLPAGGAGSAAAVATPARPAATTGIVALLRDPATLRDLVIVREVLDRPVDRW